MATQGQGDWFYDSRSGNVAQEGGIQGALSDVLMRTGVGWHGPFSPLQALVNFYNANAAKNPGWVPPQLGGYLSAYPNLTGVTAAMKGNPGFVQSAKNQLGGTASAVTGDVLGKFDLGSWFLRIGEILLGLVLVGVGIARITGAQNFVSNVVKTKLPIPA